MSTEGVVVWEDRKVEGGVNEKKSKETFQEEV